MKTSSDGINFVKRHEGYCATVYKDVAGNPTIGYGHLIKPGEVFGAVSNTQATSLLTSDLSWAEHIVTENVTELLTQWQFDALVDFVYNLGAANFISSTLLRQLNAGVDLNTVAANFGLWVHAGGVVVKGLVTRRHDEEILFLNGDYGNAR